MRPNHDLSACFFTRYGISTPLYPKEECKLSRQLSIEVVLTSAAAAEENSWHIFPWKKLWQQQQHFAWFMLVGRCPISWAHAMWKWRKTFSNSSKGKDEEEMETFCVCFFLAAWGSSWCDKTYCFLPARLKARDTKQMKLLLFLATRDI